MSKYIPFTKEEIYTAAHKDIKEYLESIGEEVLKSGSEFMWAKHDSVKIRGFVWYQHSTGAKGTAIDFLMNFYDFTFQDAVITLLDGKYTATRKTTAIEAGNVPSPNHEKTKNIVLPQKNDNNRRLYGYLCGYRKIDESVVSFFVKKKLIYEEKKNHNIVFLGKDKKGIVRYAGIKGTLSNKPFKGELTNSNKKYCFRYIGSSNVLYVFEAVVDMFSYITLYQLDKPWHTYNYVALSGLSLDVLDSFLNAFNHINDVVICTDNDYASSDGINHGQDFAKKALDMCSEKCSKVRIDTPKLKDWNEVLTEGKK